MIISEFRSYFRLSSLIMLMGTLAIGCSKKQPAPPPPDTTTATNVAITQASPPVSHAATTQAAVKPSAMSDKVAEAKNAMKAKDYQKAAAALSISSQSLTAMSAEQIAAYNSAKNALAQQVIGAAAAGDPNAKAAMDKLREDALYHR